MHHLKSTGTFCFCFFCSLQSDLVSVCVCVCVFIIINIGSDSFVIRRNLVTVTILHYNTTNMHMQHTDCCACSKHMHERFLVVMAM